MGIITSKLEKEINKNLETLEFDIATDSWQWVDVRVDIILKLSEALKNFKDYNTAKHNPNKSKG